MSAPRVLIVGGYGVFGGRLVALLEREPRLVLIVAGRSLRSAEQFVRSRRPRALLEAAAFDRDGDVTAQLAALRPTIVVDASGPFQAYGARPYRVVEACLAARVHYLDLADGSEFVAGIAQFDAVARAAGVFVLSGVSSFPVLTAAVVRYLTTDMRDVTSIRAGIAPSPYAGVGGNVIRAIASYAGQRVPLRRGGRSSVAFPFTESTRFTIGPPGHVPLRSTLFSLVDVPDLRVLPELWPQVRDVWVGAGPVPEALHRVLVACAWLVRIGVLGSLSWLAPLMEKVMNTIRWGEHRGGMLVDVAGVDAHGRTIERSWHLLAEGDDGPLIPSMAVAAVVRNVLDAQSPVSGARPAVRELELRDYAPLFAGRTIHVGTRDERATGSLYARLLGSAWNELPAEIRAMHDVAGGAEATGTVTVERGASWFARLAAAIIGFPSARVDAPIVVRFDADSGGETWTRVCGDSAFSSRQFAGAGRSARLLCERFGILTFAMAIVVADSRLSLVVRRWSALGIPLPLCLAPRAEAHETVADGRFVFDVTIRHWLAGLIVRYRGSLSRPAAL